MSHQPRALLLESIHDDAAFVLRDAGYDVATPTYVPEDREGAGPASFRNVVAQTRTGSAERVVLVGAHLDSVSESRA